MATALEHQKEWAARSGTERASVLDAIAAELANARGELL